MDHNVTEILNDLRHKSDINYVVDAEKNLIYSLDRNGNLVTDVFAQLAQEPAPRRTIKDRIKTFLF